MKPKKRKSLILKMRNQLVSYLFFPQTFIFFIETCSSLFRSQLKQNKTLSISCSNTIMELLSPFNKIKILFRCKFDRTAAASSQTFRLHYRACTCTHILWNNVLAAHDRDVNSVTCLDRAKESRASRKHLGWLRQQHHEGARAP